MDFFKRIFGAVQYWLTSKDNKSNTKNIHASFSLTDKLIIAEIIRPFIKNMNSDVLYQTLCATLSESKTLKTFVTLSDDHKEIKICFTQNEIFNEKISPFIESNFLPILMEKIHNAIPNCDIKLDKGTIIITKIK